MVGLKNKRADLTDMISFLLVMFIFAIGLFIFAFVIPQIAEGVQQSGINNSVEGNAAIESMKEIGTVTMQRGYFLLFVGFVISTMVTSFLTRVHPIFLFLYIVFLGITVLLATFLGNAYENLTSQEIFAETLASQTFINFVMTNIIPIVIIVGAISMIIVFSKFSSIGGGTARV